MLRELRLLRLLRSTPEQGQCSLMSLDKRLFAQRRDSALSDRSTGSDVTLYKSDYEIENKLSHELEDQDGNGSAPGFDFWNARLAETLPEVKQVASLRQVMHTEQIVDLRCLTEGRAAVHVYAEARPPGSRHHDGVNRLWCLAWVSGWCKVSRNQLTEEYTVLRLHINPLSPSESGYEAEKRTAFEPFPRAEFGRELSLASLKRMWLADLTPDELYDLESIALVLGEGPLNYQEWVRTLYCDARDDMLFPKEEDKAKDKMVIGPVRPKTAEIEYP